MCEPLTQAGSADIHVPYLTSESRYTIPYTMSLEMKSSQHEGEQLSVTGNGELMEQSGLSTYIDGQPDCAFDDRVDGILVEEKQVYLEAYWISVHELFPIIHKPSFDQGSAPSILLAAMMALGAQSLGVWNASSNARELHEKCRKVLKMVSLCSK